MTGDRERATDDREGPDEAPSGDRPHDERNGAHPREADQHDERNGDRHEDRTPRDGPLSDLAAEVRERTGESRTGERQDGERRTDTPQTGDRSRGSSSSREGPLADVASKVDERRRADDDDVFEPVEVGDLDGERLWEELAEGGDDDPAVAVPPEEAAPADESLGDDRDVRTIPKNTCHGCPYFADPPELACTDEAAEILAMPDADHFRVADCPVVDDEKGVESLGVESDAER